MSTTTSNPATSTVSSILAEPGVTTSASQRYWVIRLGTPSVHDPLRTGDRLGLVRKSSDRPAVLESVADGRVILTMTRLNDVTRFMALLDARGGEDS